MVDIDVTRLSRPFALALSGGGDSTALLHVLMEHEMRPTLLHFNHGWGPHAAVLQAHVEDLARAYDLPLYVGTGQGPAPLTNKEDHARCERWAWMLATARACGVEAVVTAHTRTDQVELLLMRLGRGSSLQGLVGMPDHDVREGIMLCRPLLHVTRADLRAYLTAHGYGWVEDPTNALSLRGRLRPIIAQLEQAGLGQQAMAASMVHLARAHDALAQQVPPEMPKLCAFRQLHVEIALRVLGRDMMKVSGREGPPVRTAKRLALWERIVTRPQGKATLGGCVVTWNEAKDLLCLLPLERYSHLK